MTPDLGTRLDTIVRALEQVVVPALPLDEVLAVEQATLCIGHLAMLREQYRHLADYEALCLADMTALGGELAGAASGGLKTTEAAAALREAVGSSTADVRSAAEAGPAASAAHRRRNVVAAAVDALLLASARDADPEFHAVSQRLVVAHGLRQSARDRAWFRDCGMDPEAATLPSIPELVGEHR